MQAEISGACTQTGLVPVQITITSVSGSDLGFNLFVDGIPEAGNPFQYDSSGNTTIQIFLPGDMGVHLIFINDLSDVSCQAMTQIETPDCSGMCAIDDLNIVFATPTLHLVEVRDFEFFPKHLNITLGDSVRFIWTGQIAHTSTSDATSGADAWDSGLFGNGAVYDLILTTSGIHPYYCIPHGGPGGIGMSGSINVSDVCDGDTLAADLCFTAMNGSFEGFEILIDGISEGTYAYAGQPLNCVRINVSGDGQSHDITIQDLGLAECRLDTTLIFPDCNNPCFGFHASYNFTYDPQTLEVQFNNTSSTDAIAYTWLFGDGTTSTDVHPIHAYGMAQHYEACLIAESAGGCIDTFCRSIPLGTFVCQAGFTIQSDGLSITLRDTSVTSAPITNRVWSFGDGQVAQGNGVVSHVYSALGIYEICLSIAADTCMDTHCVTIDLSDPCIITRADFTHQIIAGTTFLFTDQSSGQISSRLWGFGDGSTSTMANPEHSYASGGTYVACLLIFDADNNCSKFTCKDVMVGTTGISERHSIRPLIVFPNPVNSASTRFSVIGLANSDLGNDGLMQLYTAQGKSVAVWQVMCDDQIDIVPVKELAPGLYVLRLTTGKSIYSAKLIVR
jgi:PKD repeat protein/plastocyanin